MKYLCRNVFFIFYLLRVLEFFNMLLEIVFQLLPIILKINIISCILQEECLPKIFSINSLEYSIITFTSFIKNNSDILLRILRNWFIHKKRSQWSWTIFVQKVLRFIICLAIIFILFGDDSDTTCASLTISVGSLFDRFITYFL